MITNTSFTITCIPDAILRLKPIHTPCLQFQYSIPSISNSLIIHSYKYFTNSRQSQKVQDNNSQFPVICMFAFNNRRVKCIMACFHSLFFFFFLDQLFCSFIHTSPPSFHTSSSTHPRNYAHTHTYAYTYTLTHVCVCVYTHTHTHFPPTLTYSVFKLMYGWIRLDEWLRRQSGLK